MVRKRLYAKQTASVEYEQIDLFSLLEEEQRQADRTAEQVRGYEITVGHAAVQRLRARGADDETIAAVAAEYRENRLRGLGRRTRGSPPRTSSASVPPRPAKPRRNLW